MTARSAYPQWPSGADALVDELVARFDREFRRCSLITDDHFRSFSYTRTGNNVCHSRTLGLLVRASWRLPGVAAVDVDAHLNAGGVKFQPDLIARARHNESLFAADFESPNSSDARVTWMEVETYCLWIRPQGRPITLVSATTR